MTTEVRQSLNEVKIILTDTTIMLPAKEARNLARDIDQTAIAILRTRGEIGPKQDARK